MFLANTRLLGEEEDEEEERRSKRVKKSIERKKRVLVHIKTGEEEHKIGLKTKVEGLLCQFIIEIWTDVK